MVKVPLRNTCMYRPTEIVYRVINDDLKKMDSMDLRQIGWVRSQWKRFRSTLCVCTGIAWVICCAGIVLVDRENLPILLGLAFMLAVVTGLSIYLLWTIRRQLQALDKQAIKRRADGGV
jgi:hypothetical protein